MKRIVARVVCVALSVGVSGLSVRASEPFVVGVISPMTGPMATVGTHATVALELWAEMLNASGGVKGRKIELDICDDGGSPDNAVTCARRHMHRGVGLILNPSVSSTIRAITPLLKEGPVMIVSSPIIEPDPKGYVFQISPTDVEMTKGLLTFLKANNVKKLAMIAATDTSGESNASNAQKVFPAGGVRLSLARIDLKANDASIQLANVVKDNSVLYSAYSGAGAATVVKSFSNLGLTIPFIISAANLSESFISLIKNDMPPRLLGLGLNIMVPELINSAQQRDRLDAFTKAFQQRRKEAPSLQALQAIILADVAQAIFEGVDEPRSSAATKNYLETTPISGITSIRFSADSHIGMGSDTVAVVEYKNGRWIKADPVK